ncbi:DUF4123 domain-containing protein [Halomonas nitroreducens]|uniref:DUF4123 domain-containing protein n=1 Tax=Halomonas nitroreducens TaxID=447425 RepID=A0A3S0HPP5_9GAMM|nr:DUF4123 domain-containing protein [Halomonas nitroreducens]RTR03355.1 DUF4123 domain-containing protein [Halomonas nitroreducens]
MSQHDHAHTLEDLLPREARLVTWLVIEQEERTLQRVYELDEAPDLHWLFYGTRYAELPEKSPLVVRISASSSLWQAFVDGGSEPPLRGIMVTSRESSASVMAHLRRLLEVTFYGRRRALLRFYDPWIMAVLLGAESSVARWLGPLEGIYWYGGTFAQRAESGAVWHACTQARQEVGAHDGVAREEIALTRSEEAALETFVADYPLWVELETRAGLEAGSAEHAARFVEVLEEAQRLTIPPTEWGDYLKLRFVHFRAGLPEGMMARPVEERLSALRRHIGHEPDDTNTGKVWA